MKFTHAPLDVNPRQVHDGPLETTHKFGFHGSLPPNTTSSWGTDRPRPSGLWAHDPRPRCTKSDAGGPQQGRKRQLAKDITKEGWKRTEVRSVHRVDT